MAVEVLVLADKQLFIWRDVMQDSEAVKSPVDIDALPFGVYRLIAL